MSFIINFFILTLSKTLLKIRNIIVYEIMELKIVEFMYIGIYQNYIVNVPKFVKVK